MKRSDFTFGLKFKCGQRKWLVTDLGTRTVIAVCLTACNANDYGRSLGKERHDEMWDRSPIDTPEIDPSWLEGPPYAVAEHVFDEADMTGCEVSPP